MIDEAPSVLEDVIWVTPAMWPNCRSSGVATEDAMISGLAPGSVAATVIVGKSICGSDETGNAYADLVAPTAAERGEPWLTFLAPDDMSALLERHGFGAIDHVQQRDSTAERRVRPRHQLGVDDSTYPPRPT